MGIVAPTVCPSYLSGIYLPVGEKHKYVCAQRDACTVYRFQYLWAPLETNQTVHHSTCKGKHKAVKLIHSTQESSTETAGDACNSGCYAQTE